MMVTVSSVSTTCYSSTTHTLIAWPRLCDPVAIIILT